MTVDYMLTTVDNPFDPFTQFDDWYAFDTRMGYHSSSYLARVLRTSDELSEADQDLAIQYAIDDIVRLDILGVHMKITADQGRALREKQDRPVIVHEDRLATFQEAVDEFLGGAPERIRQSIEEERNK